VEGEGPVTAVIHEMQQFSADLSMWTALRSVAQRVAAGEKIAGNLRRSLPVPARSDRARGAASTTTHHFECSWATLLHGCMRTVERWRLSCHIGELHRNGQAWCD
jgi:hypothetical protein